MNFSKEHIKEIVTRLQETKLKYKTDPNNQDLVQACSQVLKDLQDYVMMETKQKNTRHRRDRFGLPLRGCPTAAPAGGLSGPDGAGGGA